MFRKISILVSLALLCTVFAGLSAAQDFTFQLSPINPPIIIPPEGGSFDYIIAATNNESTPQQVDVWCTMTLPDSTVTAPVLGPITITFGPGQTLSRTRTQYIPPGAPGGTWTLDGNYGDYPVLPIGGGSFNFSVIPSITPAWVTRYSYSDYANVASAIVADGFGAVIVTGRSFGWYDDYATIKYDAATGLGLWPNVPDPYGAARYNGPGNGSDQASAVALDAQGNVFVTGVSLGSGTSFDYATIKYNGQSGAVDLQWRTTYPQDGAARYDGPAHSRDRANAIVVDGENDVIVTGVSYGGATSLDYATIKYSGSTGLPLWTGPGIVAGAARYNGTGNGLDQANDIAVDAAGDVYVTGRSFGSGTYYDYVTIKYSGQTGLVNGVPIWVKRYMGSGLNTADVANALALDAAGDVYVTGSSYGGATNYDYATIKYGWEFGDEMWSGTGIENGAARYENTPYVDVAYAIAVGGGFVYVTGSSGGATGADYATLKYNAANGSSVWATQYPPDGARRYNYWPFNGSDIAHAIGVDGGGNVYVTGESQASAFGTNPGLDYATIKYAPIGLQAWVHRYNGAGGNDMAYALALDPAGNAYVTGGSNYGSGSWSAYATVKYNNFHLDNWMPVEATVLGQPLPQEFSLGQNYPNPFNPTTAISYQLAANSHVNLRVYDTAGRLVETLVDGWREAGTHELTFDASHLPSGMYVYRIRAGEWEDSGKMMLIK